MLLSKILQMYFKNHGLCCDSHWLMMAVLMTLLQYLTTITLVLNGYTYFDMLFNPTHSGKNGIVIEKLKCENSLFSDH